MEDIPYVDELFDIRSMGRDGRLVYTLRVMSAHHDNLTPNQMRMILKSYKTQIENRLLSLGDGIGDY